MHRAPLPEVKSVDQLLDRLKAFVVSANRLKKRNEKSYNPIAVEAIKDGFCIDYRLLPLVLTWFEREYPYYENRIPGEVKPWAEKLRSEAVRLRDSLRLSQHHVSLGIKRFYQKYPQHFPKGTFSIDKLLQDLSAGGCDGYSFFIGSIFQESLTSKLGLDLSFKNEEKLRDDEKAGAPSATEGEVVAKTEDPVQAGTVSELEAGQSVSDRAEPMVNVAAQAAARPEAKLQDSQTLLFSISHLFSTLITWDGTEDLSDRAQKNFQLLVNLMFKAQNSRDVLSHMQSDWDRIDETRQMQLSQSISFPFTEPNIELYIRNVILKPADAVPIRDKEPEADEKDRADLSIEALQAKKLFELELFRVGANGHCTLLIKTTDIATKKVSLYYFDPENVQCAVPIPDNDPKKLVLFMRIAHQYTPSSEESNVRSVEFACNFKAFGVNKKFVYVSEVELLREMHKSPPISRSFFYTPDRKEEGQVGNALTASIKADSFDSFKFWLQKYNARKIGDHTLLHQAAKFNRPRIIKFLLEEQKPPFKIDETTPSGRTCLHMAVRYGYTQSVEEILKHRPKLDAKLSTKAETHAGWTALHLVAKYGHANVAQLILQEEKKRNLTERTSTNLANVAAPDGKTPLHIAIEFNRPLIVEMLIANKANVAALTKDGKTPLHLAIELNRLDIVKILTRNCSDLAALIKNRNPMDLARSPQMIEYLRSLQHLDLHPTRSVSAMFPASPPVQPPSASAAQAAASHTMDKKGV